MPWSDIHILKDHTQLYASSRRKSLASEITNWSKKPLYDWDQEVQDSVHHGSLVTHYNLTIYQRKFAYVFIYLRALV